jgi:hypothetical protein
VQTHVESARGTKLTTRQTNSYDEQITLRTFYYKENAWIFARNESPEMPLPEAAVLNYIHVTQHVITLSPPTQRK